MDGVTAGMKPDPVIIKHDATAQRDESGRFSSRHRGTTAQLSCLKVSGQDRHK
jgi:hypothetical protein